MKCYLLLLGLLLVQHGYAAEPSRAVIYSCLIGYSMASTVHLDELPTNEILSEDDYKSGYSATYFHIKGKDIGYAEKTGSHGIIFAGNIYPATAAIPLLDTKIVPSPFDPSLASWSMVTNGKERYLCVSFNFEGLGRSGNFQNVRGSYLLSILPAKGSRQLFFGIANTKVYSKSKNNQ